MLEPVPSRALAALAGIRHGFFTREGGVSSGLYGSLNCGLGSKDLRGNVIENRGRMARHLAGATVPVLTCHQIHSADAVIVDRPWSAEAQPRADAIVTRTPGLVIGVLAADCTPILFADPAAGVIGAAHAGWKGALGGIVESTLAAMERAGATRQRIVAAIGPCISRQAYEVGAEFEAHFLQVAADNARFFDRATPDARPHFDLPGYVAHRLALAHIATAEMLGQCTYSDSGRFFSYRRTTHCGEPDYGRQISAIFLA